MKQRIPRWQAAKFVEVLQQEMPRDAEWGLGGSWRREAGEIGDLDVYVVTEDGLFGDFAFPASWKGEQGGGQVARGRLSCMSDKRLPISLRQETIQVDFWCCRPEQLAAMLMFITGPAALNIAQRAHAQKMGFTLSQYGLLDTIGNPFHASTEEEIYAVLELPFIPPAERQRYAEVSRPQMKDAPDNAWEVEGNTGTYIVSIENQRWRCRRKDDDALCPAFKFSRDRPATCKHIRQKQAELESA